MSKPTLISAYNPTANEMFCYDSTKMETNRKLYGNGGIAMNNKYLYANWRGLSLKGLTDSNIEYFSTAKGYGDGNYITGKHKTPINIDLKARAVIEGNLRQTIDEAYQFHQNAYNEDYVLLTIIYKGQTRQAQAILTGWKIETEKTPVITCTYMIYDGSWNTVTFKTKLSTNTCTTTEVLAEFTPFDFSLVINESQTITLYPPDTNGWNTLQFNIQFFDSLGNPLRKYINAAFLVWNDNEKKFRGTTITDTTITASTPITIQTEYSNGAITITAKYNNAITKTYTLNLTDSVLKSCETVKFYFTGTKTNTTSQLLLGNNSKVVFS